MSKAEDAGDKVTVAVLWAAKEGRLPGGERLKPSPSEAVGVDVLEQDVIERHEVATVRPLFTINRDGVSMRISIEVVDKNEGRTHDELLEIAAPWAHVFQIPSTPFVIALATLEAFARTAAEYFALKREGRSPLYERGFHRFRLAARLEEVRKQSGR